MSGFLTGIPATVIETSLRALPGLVLVLAVRRTAAPWLPAATRHALLLVAILGLPLVPIALVTLPGWEIAIPLPVAGGAGDAADLAVRSGSATPLELLSIAWAIGAAGLLARLGVGITAVWRLRRSARPLESREWRRLARRAARRLGLSRAPVLLMGLDELSPMVWGVFRPVVLLPPSAAEWPASRRFAVLAHELAHARRAEPLVHSVCEIVRALHWFNPLVWVAVRRLRAEAELAADALALRAGIGPADYAAHLVAAVRGRAPVAGAALGLASRRILGERVEELLRPGGPRRGRGGRAVAALGLAAILATAVPRLEAQELAAALAERHGITHALAASILDVALEEGIAPDVAFGLVRVESGFDARRVSGNGAVGLTQILPSTAGLVSPGLPRSALFDPQTNLRVGFRYLRDLLDRQGGDVRNALYAYSLGPKRLDEIRRAGLTPDSDYPDRVLEGVSE